MMLKYPVLKLTAKAPKKWITLEDDWNFLLETSAILTDANC